MLLFFLDESGSWPLPGKVGRRRYFGPENTDVDNSVAHLSRGKRDKFREGLFEVITKRKSIKIIACAADSVEAYKLEYIKDQEDLYYYTYKPVSERFQYLL
jgi:hypothetical protein